VPLLSGVTAAAIAWFSSAPSITRRSFKMLSLFGGMSVVRLKKSQRTLLNYEELPAMLVNRPLHPTAFGFG
jgi:hypothetical protein